MNTPLPTILVVDDQPLLLLHIQFAFEDAGYIVIQAASADEALDALDRHPQIRAVFTDVAMPGSLDGAALAERVRALYPDVAVLVTTGESAFDPAVLPQGVRFVLKPYDGHAIIGMIRADMTCHTDRPRAGSAR